MSGMEYALNLQDSCHDDEQLLNLGCLISVSRNALMFYDVLDSPLLSHASLNFVIAVNYIPHDP